MAKSKNKMSTIISELQNASKMHLRQSKELASHVKDMESPATMKSPLNAKKKKVLDHTNTTCWEGHAPKPGEPKTKISSKTGRRVNNCS